MKNLNIHSQPMIW